MSDGIYVSMNGAAARSAQLDSIADNLANTQTPGFKAERPSFEAFLAKEDSKLDATKVYTAAVGTKLDLSPGVVTQTNEPLDVLPTGSSFFGVKTERGVALTRNGHLVVDATGTLTAAGLPVVDRDGRPIVTPLGAQVSVQASGVVYANDVPVGQLGFFQPTGALDRIAPSVLAPQDPSTVVPTADTVRQGVIETGNASALEATVQLVTAQRHFETSLQALQTYKRLDDKAVDIGRIR